MDGGTLTHQPGREQHLLTKLIGQRGHTPKLDGTVYAVSTPGELRVQAPVEWQIEL